MEEQTSKCWCLVLGISERSFFDYPKTGSCANLMITVLSDGQQRQALSYKNLNKQETYIKTGSNPTFERVTCQELQKIKESNYKLLSSTR